MLLVEQELLPYSKTFSQVIIIMEENMIVIRDPKTLCYNFDWSKDVDENLKHAIEFIIKKQ